MESIKIGRNSKMPKLRDSIYSYTQNWQIQFVDKCSLAVVDFLITNSENTQTIPRHRQGGHNEIHI